MRVIECSLDGCSRMAGLASAYRDDEVVLSSVHLGAKEEPSIGQVTSEWRVSVTGFYG